MALISFMVTAKLICVFVFAFADCWFSHEAAHLVATTFQLNVMLGDHLHFCVTYIVHVLIQNITFLGALWFTKLLEHYKHMKRSLEFKGEKALCIQPAYE